jgi:methyltransferase-like protein
MLSIKSHRRKDSLLLLALISSSVAGVAFMTIASPSYINAVTNNASNTNTTTAYSLITNILAQNLENHLQKAGTILEITSKLPQVRNIPFAHLLNQTLSTLHGIPQGADIEKRQLYRLT